MLKGRRDRCAIDIGIVTSIPAIFHRAIVHSRWTIICEAAKKDPLPVTSRRGWFIWGKGGGSTLVPTAFKVAAPKSPMEKPLPLSNFTTHPGSIVNVAPLRTSTVPVTIWGLPARVHVSLLVIAPLWFKAYVVPVENMVNTKDTKTTAKLLNDIDTNFWRCKIKCCRNCRKW